MSEYPEHKKLAAIADRSQAIGYFLEWAGAEKKLTLCEPGEYTHYPTMQSTTSLLAEHFGIDQQKLEDEKRQMLAAIQRKNLQ